MTLPAVRLAEGSGWTVTRLNGKHVLALVRTGQVIEQPCDCATAKNEELRLRAERAEAQVKRLHTLLKGCATVGLDAALAASEEEKP